jgi:hypothetical protein
VFAAPGAPTYSSVFVAATAEPKREESEEPLTFATTIALVAKDCPLINGIDDGKGDGLRSVVGVERSVEDDAGLLVVIGVEEGRGVQLAS